MSRYVTKSSVEKMRKHFEDHPECQDKGKVVGIGRSIWTPGFCGGSGKVSVVCEAFCLDHHKEPNLPSHGTPIYEDQIIELGR